MKIRLFNQIDTQHLENVKEDMKQLGAPTIRVYKEDNNYYIALEGSHRITASKELGLNPKLEILTDENWNDEIDIQLDGEIIKTTVGEMVENNRCDIEICF